MKNFNFKFNRVLILNSKICCKQLLHNVAPTQQIFTGKQQPLFFQVVGGQTLQNNQNNGQTLLLAQQQQQPLQFFYFLREIFIFLKIFCMSLIFRKGKSLFYLKI